MFANSGRQGFIMLPHVSVNFVYTRLDYSGGKGFVHYTTLKTDAYWEKARMIVVPESKKTEILLIEDDGGDIEIIRTAFESSVHPTHVTVVSDGESALNYLRKKDQYHDVTRPDLILLDLNLPKKDGRELLDTIKQDPVFKIIPVVVLTGSDEDRDVIMSYMLHANAYIVKPMNYDKFARIIKNIQEFWLQTVLLP